jgi:hypothetical protein
MSAPEQHPWDPFLAAEAEGREPAADAELAALLGSLLPRLAPAPGFAARVMARLPRRRSRWSHPAVRFGLAAALAAAAVSVALVTPTLGALLGLLGPAGAFGLAVGGFAEVATRFADGLASWQPAGVVARALGRALLEPRLAVLLLAQMIVAALALRGLAAVAATERSSSHVTP